MYDGCALSKGELVSFGYMSIAVSKTSVVRPEHFHIDSISRPTQNYYTIDPFKSMIHITKAATVFFVGSNWNTYELSELVTVKHSIFYVGAYIE